MIKYLFAIIIIVILFLIFIKFIPGYMLLSTITDIFEKYADYNPEFYNTDASWCEELRNNYKIIYEEYVNYTKNNKLKRYKEIDPNQKIADISDIPWDILFLRTYNKNTDKIKYFPKTYKLISKIPNCTLAMFSILHPGKIIPPHRGIYNGVLRYHLALKTPKDNDKCYIVVNNIKYHWKEGNDIIFDDFYTHYVKNETDECRVVLFLDIKKQFNNVFLDTLNNVLLYFGKFNNTVIDVVKNTNDS